MKYFMEALWSNMQFTQFLRIFQQSFLFHLKYVKCRTFVSLVLMERSGYIAPVQVGGTGIGFDSPQSLLYDEPRLRAPMAKCILLRAQQRADDSVSTGSIGTLNNWRDALTRRFLLLHSISTSRLEGQDVLTKASSPTSIIHSEEKRRSTEQCDLDFEHDF